MAKVHKEQDRLKEGYIRLKRSRLRYANRNNIESINVGGSFWKWGKTYTLIDYDKLKDGLIGILAEGKKKYIPLKEIDCINLKGCVIATAIYGNSAPETNAFRRVRDGNLRQHPLGNAFVWTYYHGLGNLGVRLMEKLPKLKPLVKRTLDKLILRYL